MPDRPQKITFAEVRESGVHGCSCAAPTIAAVIRSPHWPDDLSLSDIESRFVCQACGKRGAEAALPQFRRAAI